MIRTTRHLRLIFVVLFAVLILNCNNTVYQQQLSKVVASLRSTSSNLADGKVISTKIEGLKENQILVVINSAYAGSIKPEPSISKKMVHEILNYAISETGNTFFLLIENDNIVASFKVPGPVFQTSLEPFLNNAKIARPGKQVAHLTCTDLDDPTNNNQWDYWSPNCKTIQLIKFVED